MRVAVIWRLLFLAIPLLAADDDEAFTRLSGDDQIRNWSGDRAFWTWGGDEIRGRSARQSSPLVYEGQTFGNYVLRFSAQVQTGSVRIQLRNVWFFWTLEIDTERVWLRGGGGDGFAAFLNKPGELADYEARVEGGSVRLWRNGKPADFDFVVNHAPETGKISLHLAETDQGSTIVIRKLRIRAFP